MDFSHERTIIIACLFALGYLGVSVSAFISNQVFSDDISRESNNDESLRLLEKNSSNFTSNQVSYTFVTDWGTRGTGEGQFLRPHDLEFDKNYKYLYVVDTYGNRIQVFDKNGKFLFKFGEIGYGDGQFRAPYGIDIDVRGNIWVADRGNHRIQEFDSQGNFISKFGNTDALPSNRSGYFYSPKDIEVDKALRYVFVADSNNNRIQQFEINGKFVKSIGGIANESGGFNLPASVKIDSNGNFFVNNVGNDRIQKFDSKWNLITAWGSRGTSNNKFCGIEHIDLDKDDNVFVTDTQSYPACIMEPRVLKFDSDGNFLTKFGSKGTLPGQFRYPEQLALDDHGNVYVSDRSNNNIQVFRPIIGN